MGLWDKTINPLNAELNFICHLLTLLEAHHILHVSRIRVKLLRTPLIGMKTRGLSCKSTAGRRSIINASRGCNNLVSTLTHSYSAGSKNYVDQKTCLEGETGHIRYSYKLQLRMQQQ